jgi:hypothetical protein
MSNLKFFGVIMREDKKYQMPETALIYQKHMQKKNDLSQSHEELYQELRDELLDKMSKLKTEKQKEKQQEKINLLEMLLNKYVS